MSKELPRRRLAVGLVLTTTLLSSCGDNYPRDWPRVDRDVFAALRSNGCPEISGTFRISPEARNEETVRTHRVALEDTFVGKNATAPRRFPWETMTISGDITKELTLTFGRSPVGMSAYREELGRSNPYQLSQYYNMLEPETRHRNPFDRMSDEEYEKNLQKMYLWPKRTVTLRHDRDYKCSGGWIITARFDQVMRTRTDSPQLPAVENGEVLVAKDKEGHLVAHAKYTRAEELTLWCGDGCKGIPLGAWTRHDWGRWTSSEPAWPGEVPRPWAESPKPPADRARTVTPLHAVPVASIDEVGVRIRTLLPVGVLPGPMAAFGTGFKITVYCETEEQLAQLLRNIDRSPVLATFSPELAKNFRNSADLLEATILLRDKREPKNR